MSGSGGCLVHRIIGSDYSNIYWDKGINNATDDSLDPLLWPDSGFHIQKPHSIPETEQANYTCHTGSSMFHKEQEVDRTVLSLIIKANKVYKKAVIRTHDSFRKYNKHITIVRIVGNKNKLGRKLSKNHDFLDPIQEPNTLNLNINNLIAEDYNTFLNECNKLSTYLNIKLDIKKVRKFILIWVRKQYE
jgi:hypothetical protein